MNPLHLEAKVPGLILKTDELRDVVSGAIRYLLCVHCDDGCGRCSAAIESTSEAEAIAEHESAAAFLRERRDRAIH